MKVTRKKKALMESVTNQHKLAFFAAVSAFIGVIENFIPLPIPFLRLGLANIPICLGFSLFNFGQITYIVFFKVLMIHLFRGTLFSYPFLIALMGNALFLLMTFPLYFLFKKRWISFFSISLTGAIAHNLGQLLLALFLLPQNVVFNLSLFFLFSGSIMGSINGIICNILYPGVIARFFMENPLYQVHRDYIQCRLCPNFCKLKEEHQFGVCGVRKRENDCIVNPFSGILSAESMDPIEKKPLYHFYPGSQIFSIGFYGCTLKCKFCQNHSISQHKPPPHAEVTQPKELVDYIKKQGLKGIAFTYSEPTLYFEWVLETARLCRKNDIKTVLVTNGYLNPEAARTLLAEIDGANIDLKAFHEDFYQRLCSARLEPVKEFIKIAWELKVHIELTTLVITRENDSLEECGQITNFIAALSPDIPYHISRYHPSYQFNAPPTSEKTIKSWVLEAQKKLHYVYGGNVAFDNDTKCKKCQHILVSRSFYQTDRGGLSKEGRCKKCGSENYFKQ
ncbi:MAG: AmmeMemoRadiSam system radical SAM enzyme [Spirochaetes bacterium]|nr:AmmeMemoRadiSam system radical SAM enzyme [Spirochaetota bacterium]